MEQLGDYLVRRLIGEGGMGKVYEGEERLSKRRVALKVLHQEVAKSEAGRRLFLNEMQILASLEHPNIVRSLASIEVDGELVMVLEYLDGRTLRGVLNAEERMPWTEAIGVVAAIASALEAAHGQKPPIIHRDLKPENIMVLADGSVKVMDFGIAKVIEALNQTNTQSVGTLQYMSPEQIDAHTIDHRSDLYCLGLIFYELLAGRPPFQSASPRQLLNLQCTAEAPPLEDDVRRGLPKGVELLLFQLLEKAPEDRPYLAQDVVDRLEPFQAAGGPQPRPSAAARVSGPARASGASSTPHRAAKKEEAEPPADEEEEEEDDEEVADEEADDEEEGGEQEEERASKPEPRAREARGGEPRRAAKKKRAISMGPQAAPNPRSLRERSVSKGDDDSEPPRADTIELLERLERGPARGSREVPTGKAIAVVLVLSAIAGIAAYVMRSTSTAPETPKGGATADIAPAPVFR